MPQHYDDVTLALLALGEPGVTPDSDAHLATCEHCRREVESLGAAAAVGRRVQPDDSPVSPSPQVWDRIVRDLESPTVSAVPESASTDAQVVPLEAAPSRRRSRALPLLAAAAVGVIVGCGGTYAVTHSAQPAATVAAPAVATASLKPLDDPRASGTAVIRQASTAQRTVTVTVKGLPGTTPGSFYEVWLMDPSNAHLVALGVLDADGHGEFAVPDGLDLNAYSAIDVSLQPMNGSPLHSGDSPVRGELST